MKFFTTTTLLALASSVAANNWTLYCGDDCSDGTAIVSGSDYQGTTCTDFSTEYEYCYLESDVAWYKALIFENADCVVSSDGPETVIWPGECTSSGTFNSYEVAVNL